MGYDLLSHNVPVSHTKLRNYEDPGAMARMYFKAEDTLDVSSKASVSKSRRQVKIFEILMQTFPKFSGNIRDTMVNYLLELDLL